MNALPLPRHALAGGPADGFAGRAWRMSRSAVIASIVAHLALLYAASRWYEAEPAPIEATFEWLTVLEAPTEPLVPPSSEVAEPAVPVIAPAPAPSPRAVTARSVSPPVVVPLPETPAEVLPAPPLGPSRLDLDTARRAAAAAVVEQHARDSTLLAPSIDDVPRPQPPRAPAPRKPSIFDHEARSGRSLMHPGKQRTVVGQRLSLWCNKVSGGGFGFFGIPVCASQGIEPPSGILADSIPEYMKLKPECEETQPLAVTLGEKGPFPTMKCRLVPKEPDE
jgi:hypothetical protein